LIELANNNKLLGKQKQKKRGKKPRKKNFTDTIKNIVDKLKAR